MPDRFRHFGRILLIALFVTGLCLPGLDQLLSLDRSEPLDEKRVLAPFPQFHPGRIREWPARFEKWFQDHFGFRTFLIRQNSRFRVAVLGDSPDDDVLLGRDGWMYLKFGPGKSAYYRGRMPYTFEEMELLRRELELRRDWLSSRGVEYLAVIAPEKASVHPEAFPYRIAEFETRADQFVRHMRERSTVPLLDLRGPLRAAAKEGPVFYRTDTHWNEVGAGIAYDEICRSLTDRFPTIRPIPRADCRLVDTGKKGDLAEKLGIAPYSAEVQVRPVPPPERAASPAPNDESPNVTYKRYRIDDAALPKLVCFHDSFGIALRGLLAAHFQRTLLRAWADFDPRTVLAENPDLVIDLQCERNWFLHPPRTPRTLREWALRREFESAPPLFDWKRGEAPPVEGFRAIHHARVKYEDRVVRVRSDGGSPLVMLPAFQKPADGRILVRMIVESPGKLTARAFLQDGRTGQAKRSSAVKLTLQRGDNELHFELEPGPGRLLVQFDRSDSPYRIHGLSIRGAGDGATTPAPPTEAAAVRPSKP